MKIHVKSLTLLAVSGIGMAHAIPQTYPIVDTNQTSCFSTTEKMASCPKSGDATYGQDSQYQGLAPNYTDNKDGTVTDNNTGLMWQQTTDTNGDGKITAADKMTYDQAQAYAKQLTLAGYDDWRVPSIKELYSLMLFDGQDPSGPTDNSGKISLVPFIDSEVFAYNAGDTNSHERLIDGQYVSSTKYVSTTMQDHQETIFGVNFTDGRIKGYANHDPHGQADGKTFYVQLVRGNTDYGKNDFVDNGDGTLSDNATGLTWQQDDSEKGMNFPAALSYCEDLTLAGNSDWRLPNAKELQSIVDYSRSPDTTDSAAISPLFTVSTITNEAGNKDFPNYWSSTTHQTSAATGNGKAGAYVAFGRSLGNMGGWVDVHGAGAQRSDPKVNTDGKSYPDGHGPQGDAVRFDNYVKCVTGGNAILIQQPKHIQRKADTFAVGSNGMEQGNGQQREPSQGMGKRMGGGKPSAENLLKMMDSNSDNRLSKSEAKGPLKNDFSKVDSNGDGYLSKDELEKAPKPPQGRQNAGRPPQGSPQGAPQGKDDRNVCQALQEGPQHSSEHGPMDNADLNKDGTVYREELENFMNQGEYRRVTILAYFDRFDTDKDGKLSDAEMAKVTPSHSFNGTDANGDCVVSREEVIAYANEEGRSYRKIGLGEFFDLVDTNDDNKATPEEIEAAHVSGLLARY